MDSDLRKCLNDIIGEQETKNLLDDAIDIHDYAKLLENNCERGPEISACYTTAMTQNIECVKKQDKEIDGEMMQNGMKLVQALLNIKCDSVEKSDFIQYSKKLEECESKGFKEISRCIREKVRAQDVLYGFTLARLQFVDKTKCRAMKRYQDCILKEWAKCDATNEDIGLREKAKRSMDGVHDFVGCSNDDYGNKNDLDERFYQLKQIDMCKRSYVS